ncbi:Hsp20/alpha crystallin family protein [Neolewinella agarilytica]|uniref:HSP20 family protein n=1 Tax=Neolewinella agarilytica TaxID=478744 RepID=A0A1H9C407_9BACT|nr:Hsp20/alpha crystallin family protein [Neolewinella agarilytica]SEP95899.1 HSP20 family protein [Neolewinella agarilytica]
MKLINYNRPFPTNFARFFDDHRTMATDAYRPAVNITETDEVFELELLAPGREKDNFNIAFNEGVLEITYTTPTTDEDSKPRFRLKEFRLADFTRRFKLDAKMIKDEAIDASYINGVLRLTLPKREEALPKPPRQIAVG